jgi:16S rRNA (adenine1518-N6/adenine1519-N6)-dimethyltransferase
MELTNIHDIRGLLDRHGFRFSRSLGQNFLISASVPERIADEADLSGTDSVLEIGPGIGCLTVQLAARAGRVLCVEADRRLESVLNETLRGTERTEVVFADALKADLPALCRERDAAGPWKLCSNLPYNITSPLLTAVWRSEFFESVTVMVQKEVAERICAAPGTKEYGAFSVLAQWYTDPEILFAVPPGAFLPAPKVTSAVVRMDRRAEKPCAVADEELFFRTVRAAFGQRRKTLLNALSSGFPELSRDDLQDCIHFSGFDPQIRGESLDIPQFSRLSNELCRKLLK